MPSESSTSSMSTSSPSSYSSSLSSGSSQTSTSTSSGSLELSSSSSASSSQSSESSTGAFGISQVVLSVASNFCLTATKLHTTRYRLSILDVNDVLIPIATSNIVRVKIGRDNTIPILDINSTEPTGSSTITNVNPVLLVLDQAEMTFTAGIYDMEIMVMDDATGDVVTQLAHGILVIQDSQLGDFAV